MGPKMNRDRALSLIVLLAFLAAQSGAMVHRFRHTDAEAAEQRAAEHACPHAKSTVHFCAAAVGKSHRSDCALCLNGAAHSGVPVGKPVAFRNTTPAIHLIHYSFIAPKAPHLRLPDSRAPPA
jgi:hypothetical protein